MRTIAFILQIIYYFHSTTCLAISHQYTCYNSSNVSYFYQVFVDGTNGL